MKRAVLFAVIFFVAPAAHAAFTSGKQLSQGCGKRDMAGEFFCMAYISGVLDSNSQCGPYPFSLREAMGIVASWLAADPARQNLPGSEVVVSPSASDFPARAASSLPTQCGRASSLLPEETRLRGGPAAGIVSTGSVLIAAACEVTLEKVANLGRRSPFNPRWDRVFLPSARRPALPRLS